MGTELLMTPGPTEVSDRVIRALVRPAMMPNDHRAFEIIDETCGLLKKIFTCDGDVILLPGSGRTGMEAVITSVIEPGDKVLAVISGVFGEWVKAIVERVEGIPIELRFDYGKPIDLSAVKKKFREDKFKAVALVHNETSTGATNAADKVGEIVRGSNSLFILDCVSSLGGIPVDVNEWNVDLCFSGPQKCLGGLLGLSVISVSKRAWDVMEQRKKACTSYTLDLLRWKQLWLGVKPPKPYPVLLPPHFVFALNEAVKEVLEEGLDVRFERHRMAGKAMREGIKALGLGLLADEGIASNVITAVNVPTGLTESDLVSTMWERYQVFVGGGLGSLEGRIIRFGHMANTAREICVTRALSALEMALLDLKQPVEYGVGVEAAKQVYKTGV
jgi:aspartate aminotransferase-like enzyme